MLAFVLAGPLYLGCDMGMLPPSTALVEKMARIEAARLDEHDANITEQHKIQTPELAAELDAQRALFAQRMEEFDNQLAQARAVQDKAWQQIIKTVADVAGLPAIVADKLMPEIDAVNDEAKEAATATALVAVKLENLVKLKEELQLTPAELEALKGMTTGEILALLASAVGAAGLGIAGGKSGKSRSQPDIEKLKDSVSGITAEIERMKPPKA